jgi:uncharacterized oxidoreductase
MAEFKGLVVITGASRGIGGALVRKFDEAGYPVLAVARTPAEAQESGTVATLAADLTRQTGLAQVMAAVRARGIPVAALINNAGVQNALALAAAGPDRCGAPDADSVGSEIALNLTAPIRLSRGLIPLMRQPGGTIVNVTSLVSRHPKPSAPVYSATKAGLASFTESPPPPGGSAGHPCDRGSAAPGRYGDDRGSRHGQDLPRSHGGRDLRRHDARA